MTPTVDFTAFAPIDDLFRELLAVSLTGVILYTPMYDAAGEISDFTFEYLNPAAQRMMRMPERPTLTHHGQWPHSREHGTFDFHVEAFVTGEPRKYNINYQADGYDNYYRLAARRVGDALLVSFTDTSDQPRSPVEQALRASQAAEKAARADAESQRQRFHEVLMHLPAHVALHEGPDQVFTFVNPRYQRQAPGLELLGQPIRQIWPELVSHGILDRLAEVYHTGEPFEANELPVQVDFSRTGRLEQVYYNFFFLALRDARGQINGVLNFSYDVTDLVRARQQLEQLNQDLEARVAERSAELVATAQRQAHEREAFYQIFEQTPALIALLRAPGHRYEYVNPAYQDLFPGRPLLGLDAAEAVPELVPQGFVALLDSVYKTGETYYGAELPFTAAAAAGRPARTYYFNFTYQAYWEGDEIAGVSVFAFDVTGPVLARQRQERERQELEQLFMQAPAPIVILDGPELVFQLVNPAYQRIFPGRELLNKPLLEALPELADTPIPELFQHVYQTGEPVVMQEMMLMMARHEGQPLEEIYWTFTYQARRDAHGIIDGVRVFAHDITEQVRTRDAVAAGARQARELAEQLSATNQQLTRVNVDLDTFIYTASHDLKAPITNIEGLVQALLNELPTLDAASEVPFILGLMQDSVERFARTIEHLTDVSKLHKAFDEPTYPVPLAAIIDDVRLDLAPLLRDTGGRLDVDVQAVPTVTFSEKNLRSVVFNLLSNALKYRHPDRPPLVQLRARPEGAFVRLEVQDNGLGLDLSRETQLFAMFQRLHSHVPGSGVGLYMVKRLVENAGGRITVSSTVGEGSTFAVYLPR